MERIKVNKAQLIAKLRENRDQHQAEYEAAMVVYRKRFVAAAEKFFLDSTERAERGEKFEDFEWLPVPERHTEDYDRIIDLLEWDITGEIMLSQEDFNTFVLNQWGWSRSFAATTSSYVAR